MDALTGYAFAAVRGPDPEVDALIARHESEMRSATPADSCHVLDSEALRSAGATVYALRDITYAVCSIGALKPIGRDAVELKSMHTPAHLRRRGLGRILLEELLEAARGTGVRHAYLETGSDESFAPARALYETLGFAYCDPFGDYRRDPLSVYMHRLLA